MWCHPFHFSFFHFRFVWRHFVDQRESNVTTKIHVTHAARGACHFSVILIASGNWETEKITSDWEGRINQALEYVSIWGHCHFHIREIFTKSHPCFICIIRDLSVSFRIYMILSEWTVHCLRQTKFQYIYEPKAHCGLNIGHEHESLAITDDERKVRIEYWTESIASVLAYYYYYFVRASSAWQSEELPALWMTHCQQLSRMYFSAIRFQPFQWFEAECPNDESCELFIFNLQT